MKKGDALEDKAYEIIKSELSEGNLGIAPAMARSFQKKGYFSKDREKDIIVDLSIEVWLPNAENYSLLWVGECKNYGHKVPVDDVEEFKAKLDQIAGKNVKGVIISTNSYQSGALNYAKNQGIGLIRLMPDGQVKWVVHFMTSSMIGNSLDSREFNAALVNEHHQAVNRSFYSACDGYILGSWQAFLKHSLSIST